jgi:hypothetical protein
MKEQLRNFIVKINVPMTGFLLYLLYSFITGFSIASSIVSFALCGLYGFKMLLDQRKMIDANEELLRKINYIESSVNVLKFGSGVRTQENNERSKKLF